MKDRFEYLSDEELNKLIASVELEGMVTAPEDVQDNVLKAISNKGSIKPKKITKIEYYRYVAKVCATVAAAILILTFLPYGIWEDTPIPSREEVVDIKTREEVMKESEKHSVLGNLDINGFINSVEGKLK